MKNSHHTRSAVNNNLARAIPKPATTPQAAIGNLSPGELVLIRGLPGSGKSTMAKEFARNGYAHFEADMYFVRDGKYQYDSSQIRDAHAWCQRMTRLALARGKSVVVSNTFTQLREMAPYRSMSRQVRVIEATGRWQNTHGVPAEMLERMAQRWEPLSAPGG